MWKRVVVNFFEWYLLCQVGHKYLAPTCTAALLLPHTQKMALGPEWACWVQEKPFYNYTAMVFGRILRSKGCERNNNSKNADYAYWYKFFNAGEKICQSNFTRRYHCKFWYWRGRYFSFKQRLGF